MTMYPTRAVAEAVPSADAVTALALHEEQVYDIPALWSWLSAGEPNGSGVYADRSRRGNNWLQATEAAQPEVIADALSSGLSGWDFDNDPTLFLEADFAMPVSDRCVIGLASLDSGTSTGDGELLAFMGSGKDNVTPREVCCQTNRKARLVSRLATTSVIHTDTLSVDTPHIFVWNYSSSSGLLSVSQNGGAWVDAGAALGVNAGLRDITAYLGFNKTSFFPKAWYGFIFEALVFAEDMRLARNADDLQTVLEMLAAKGGITLP